MDYDLLLFDRIEKIKQINEEYDLEHNGYISFSGGKDSTVLHYLLDIALPGNKIPRLFINTGIEFIKLVKFVREMQVNDNRIIIINSGQNIKKMLEENGYPFKSKQHAHNLAIYQNSGWTKTIESYMTRKDGYGCPKILRYQFEGYKLPFKVSEKCCIKLKKQPAAHWAKENKRSIVMTGMRKAEGGLRNNISCTVFEDNKLKKFHPLAPLTEEFMNEFIKRNNVQLCELYYPPYNFKRTGCKGCPFALKLQQELEKLKEVLPNEYHNCENLWAPVYEEYRRINYRLKDTEDAICQLKN